MALTWTVDHKARLTSAVANGALSGADVDHWIAALVGDGVLGYRVILDATTAEFELHSAELAAFSKIAGARRLEGFDGALALIVESDAESEMAAYFARRTNDLRPCRAFRSVEAAQAWFAELDAASRD